VSHRGSAQWGHMLNSGVEARARVGAHRFESCWRFVLGYRRVVCETSRAHRFRTSIGTTDERNGRTCTRKKTVNTAVLSAAAEKGIRCAGWRYKSLARYGAQRCSRGRVERRLVLKHYKRIAGKMRRLHSL